MNKLIVQPTAMAQWHALINEAQLAAHRELSEDLESYLVFLLMRFVEKPQIAATIFAVEYIESLLKQGHDRKDKLRDVGDLCLLYSSLFPQRAKRKRVNKTYFIDLGRSAYHHLSILLTQQTAVVFHELAHGFDKVTDVLRATRKVGSGKQLVQMATGFQVDKPYRN